MNTVVRNAIVSDSFDNLRSKQVRFLEEAHKIGFVDVLLWSDKLVQSITGHLPKFPQEERLYCLQSLRYVDRVRVISKIDDPHSLPTQVWDELNPGVWVVDQTSDNPQKRLFCASVGMGYQVIPETDLLGFPFRRMDAPEALSRRKKVIVTGCYDWLHSGHVRFFEEVSGLGDLFVVVGSDANVRLLKGTGHPLVSQDERRYMVQAVRFVHAALISTGKGWMDAEPEIELIRPDIYVVNDDGDQPEKRRFCAEHGLDYVVLKRLPRPGLPRRESTVLRGF
jgi:cytidyltransferase-like protein